MKPPAGYEQKTGPPVKRDVYRCLSLFLFRSGLQRVSDQRNLGSSRKLQSVHRDHRHGETQNSDQSLEMDSLIKMQIHSAEFVAHLLLI